MQVVPPKLGSFTNSKRFSKAEVTPGVGDYNLNGFKSLGKVSETEFQEHSQLQKFSSVAHRHIRSRSAMRPQQRNKSGGDERT